MVYNQGINMRNCKKRRLEYAKGARLPPYKFLNEFIGTVTENLNRTILQDKEVTTIEHFSDEELDQVIESIKIIKSFQKGLSW